MLISKFLCYQSDCSDTSFSGCYFSEYNVFISLQVSRHLTKLFDSMAKLEFEKDDKGNCLKQGIGMYSKDGEYVNLDKTCDLNGQVTIL